MNRMTRNRAAQAHMLLARKMPAHKIPARITRALVTGLGCLLCLPVLAQAASDPSPALYDKLIELCAETKDYVDSIQMQIGNTEMVVNGETVSIDGDRGTTPIILEGRTMLPARPLVDSLGGDVKWDAATKEIEIRASDDTNLKLQIGNRTALVNGQKETLQIAPTIRNERTYIPVNSVSTLLGCSVEWEAQTKTVTITQDCQTCRLVVCAPGKSANELPATGATEVLDFGDGLFILTFDSIPQTETALHSLEAAGVEAWPDQPVQASLDEGTTVGSTSGSTLGSAFGSTSRSTSGSWGWYDDRCGLSDFVAQAGNREVNVGVIDSGLDTTAEPFRSHPERVLLNKGLSLVYQHKGAGEAALKDGDGHGTSVSSLIAQHTPDNVKIVPIRLFDEDGSVNGGPDMDFFSLWSVAVKHAGQVSDIVNMSLSTVRTPQLDRIIRQYLTGKGVPLVCSAGNFAMDTAQRSPANMGEAIVVAATDEDGKPWYTAPGKGTNYGESVDLAAPGRNIAIPTLGGVMKSWTGTSFSTPMVTAAAAVLLTQDTYSPRGLEAELTKRVSAFPAGVSGSYGAGILDLHSEEPDPDTYQLQLGKGTLEPGQSTKATVTAVYPDGKKETVSARFTSSDSSVVSVSGSTLKANKAGTARIQAAGLTTSPTAVTVTVVESPNKTAAVTAYRFDVNTLEMVVGTTAPIGVTAEYSDGTTRDVSDSVTLTSTDTSVASVSGHTVRAVAEGKARISLASLDASISLPRPIQVKVINPKEKDDPVEIVAYRFDVSSLEMTAGETATVHITAEYSDGTTRDVSDSVTLTSTDTRVASVSGHTVRAVTEGKARISLASLDASISLPRPIQVKVIEPEKEEQPPQIVAYRFQETTLEMTPGETATVHVLADYSDGTTRDVSDSVTLTSSNTNVASVSGRSVQARQTGKTLLSLASLDSAIRLPQPITVIVTERTDSEPKVVSIRYDHTRLELNRGQSTTLLVYARYSDGKRSWDEDITADCSFTISPAVATIEPKTGTVTGVQAGSGVLSFTTSVGSGNTVELPKPLKVTITEPETEENIPVTRVVVSPGSSHSLKPGDKLRLQATPLPYEATDRAVTWSTSDPSVATVSNGTVTAVASGECTITAQCSTGQPMEVHLEVHPSGTYHIDVSNVSRKLANGDPLCFSLDVETPVERVPGSRDLVLWVGVHLVGKLQWIELDSQWYDGGSQHIDWEIDASKLEELPPGNYALGIGIFPTDNYITGGALYSAMTEYFQILP